MSGSRILLRTLTPFILIAFPLALGACSKKKSCGSPVEPIPEPKLIGISISPRDHTIEVEELLQFLATGFYDDESEKDITGLVSWTSSANQVAEISDTAGSKGLATGLFPGMTIIEASLDDISDSTTLTVIPPTLISIEVTPVDPIIEEETEIQFQATGIFSNETTQDLTTEVTWSSSDTAVATISNASGSEGEATGRGEGTTTITATLDDLSGSTTLTVVPPELVSIEVTPPDPTIPVEAEIQFTAMGIFSNTTNQDLTAQVTWSSSDPQVATISNEDGTEGFALGLMEGITTIAAALDDVSGSTSLTVVPATLISIEVTPTNPFIALGTKINFTATGIYDNEKTQDLTTQVTWSSSDTAVATISNTNGSKGEATGREEGTTTITATLDDVSGSTTLTVTPAELFSIDVTPTNPSIAAGTKINFQATGNFTDGSTQDLTEQVTWSSSNTAVATISNASGSKGEATGRNEGITTITATLDDVSGSTTLTVTPAELLTIEVTPADPSIALGTTQAFTATGTFTDGSTQNLTDQVTWSSSNTAVATISNAIGSKGVATGASEGMTTITATQGDVSGSTTLTVTPAILLSLKVTPVAPTIAARTTLAFTATGTFSDGNSQNLTNQVTWSSSNTAVATISNASGSRGAATGVSEGVTLITATLDDVSDSTTLTVTPAPPVSIDVTPKNPTITVGKTQDFTATGIFEDGGSQDLTDEVTWSSSDTQVATVSNAILSKGMATGVSRGVTTITATLDDVSGSTTLTVEPGFRRCDSNMDEVNDIADAVTIVSDLFYGTQISSCRKAADCNDDGFMNLQDAIYCIAYQLMGGPRPPAPFPSCGFDPTDDGLSCVSHPPCE